MKTTPKIPIFYLTLNISLEDRKRVFDLLVENEIPMDDDALDTDGEIEEDFPYLVWSHKRIIVVRTLGYGPILSPDDFLSQFNIKFN